MNNFKTPLRYPGGKQRLSPFIKELLDANNITGHYVEPYAGGAGVAIQLLLSRRVQHIHLNDFNPGIYAFWYSVINHNEELCNLITTASLTVEEWRHRQQIVRNPEGIGLLELGFSVFYLNRCNRSGVLSGGVIGGLDQTGNYKMDARFNRDDLVRRVESIGIFKDHISISNLDAEYYINNYIPNLPDNSLIYFDPPYYVKGGELYTNAYKRDDHIRLSNLLQNIRGNWILSYDGVPEILNLYQDRRYFLYNLQYNAAKVYKGQEIFIFSDTVQLPASSSLKYIDTGITSLVNG